MLTRNAKKKNKKTLPTDLYTWSPAASICAIFLFFESYTIRTIQVHDSAATAVLHLHRGDQDTLDLIDLAC
jgi:hypothetical protein